MLFFLASTISKVPNVEKTVHVCKLILNIYIYWYELILAYNMNMKIRQMV